MVGRLPTNHLQTTYQPLTDHLPTTYQPPTDHLRALTDHLPTNQQQLTEHLPPTYWPPTNHLPTTYRPPTDHPPTTYRPPTDQHLTDHLPTTYRPLFYGAACSIFPVIIVNAICPRNTQRCILTISLPCLSVQMKHDICKNKNKNELCSVTKMWTPTWESTQWELSYEWSHL